MNRKGFTLTELITVIVIIGVVLLIVIPVTTNIMGDNDKEKGMAYVQTLENAVNTYCDMYSVEDVTYKDLKEENLIDESTDVLSSTLNDETAFKRENGKVVDSKKNVLSISLTINGNSYTCTKISCKKQ